MSTTSLGGGIVSSAPTTEPATWFVAYTDPRAEKKAGEGFKEKGWDFYFPQSSEWKSQTRLAKHRREPKVEVLRPLFPRYVMVALPGLRTPFGVALAIDGVRDFVRTAWGPIAISASIVEKVRAREQLGDFNWTTKNGRIVTARWMKTGAPCVLNDGPFRGFAAFIEDCLPGERLKVEVTIFGRSTIVEVEASQVDYRRPD